MADGFQFFQIIRPGQQVLAALKWLPPEVGTKPVRKHGNIHLIRHVTEMGHLFLCKKLRFVDQDAMQRILFNISRNNVEKVVAL